MQEIQHRYETVRGIRFHYVMAGDGEPVVLLHGFPQTWYCWRHQIPALAERFQTIAIDLKGFGESDKPSGEYRLPAITSEMVDLFDALGLDRPAVVGHDWGGVVAFDIARTFPDSISRLVAINAPLHKVDTLRSWYVFAFQIPGLPEWLFRRSGDALIERGIINAARIKNAFAPEDLKVYQDAFRSRGVHSSALAYYRALKTEALPQNRRRYSSRIDVPALVIWSEEDPILPPALTDGMHRIIPHLKLEFVPDSGHFMPEEQPEEVNRLLLDWLGSVDRQGRSRVA